ncbi:calcium-binding protein [Variovorax sp. J22G73]|uniref:calcium-binding protein n=1 Tax=unclassified Variovorax TaxID=663243 RepID=UPI0025768AFA|nr:MULTISPECIES: calcium-binding protein [unclassified Variovorax]MDM0010118.1 calcium-binding protein [Variovorax sp. J22R203]MDM0103023.1 calcium-binding protein [Variovorax sp. J22G73]
MEQPFFDTRILIDPATVLYTPGQIVSYSFLMAAPIYEGHPELSALQAGFKPFSPEQRILVRRILDEIESITTLKFVEADRADPTTTPIRFGNVSQTINGGQNIQFPPNSTVNDIYITNDPAAADSDIRIGKKGVETLIHEILHSLGLKHPFDGGISSGTERRSTSVMSYTSSYYSKEISAITPLIHDVDALQAIYGSNSTFSLGSNNYSFSEETAPTDFNGIRDFEIFRAQRKSIWDTGGIDTLDASLYKNDSVYISLVPGSLSSIGATYNIGISSGSVIENAIGGAKADKIIGNDFSNNLNGGLGNDTLSGGSGKDQYIFNGAYGKDVVYDADVDSILNFGGTVLSGNAKAIGGKLEWLLKVGAQQFVLRIFGDAEHTNLLINKKGDNTNSVTVADFDLEKAFASQVNGIKLERPAVTIKKKISASPYFDPEYTASAGQIKIGNGGGDFFTAFLSLPVLSSGKLVFSLEGSSAGNYQITTGDLTLPADGAEIDLSRGMSQASFMLHHVGGADDGTVSLHVSYVDSDGTIASSQSWQISPTELLTASRTFFGDQRALISGVEIPQNGAVYNTYDWSQVSWASNGDLVGGKSEPDFNDVIFGSAGNDVVKGLGGNDALDGRAGNDSIEGGAGDDLLGGGAGSDTLHGGAGNDYIFGATGINIPLRYGPDDSWHPPTGEPVVIQGSNWGIYTEANGDYAVSGGGFLPMDTDGDVAYGEAGNDRIVGGFGADYLDGGADNDVLTGHGGDDVLLGGAGHDYLNGDGIKKLDRYESLDAALHGSDFLDGGTGNDTLLGGGRDDVLFGGADDDMLWGDDSDAEKLPGIYHGADYLNGEGGNDQAIGGGKDDTLYGGAGNDTLVGDSEDESKLGGAFHGNDYLDGGADDDFLVGGGKDDTLYGGMGNDNLSGDDSQQHLAGEFHGADLLDGGEGNDQLVGGGGDDSLLGGKGTDALYGDDSETQFIASSFHGNDYLDGGEGNDQLRGGGGNDTLVGGKGSDTLEGGSGDDRYVISSADVDADAATVEVVDDFLGINVVAFDSEVTAVGGTGGDLVVAIGAPEDHRYVLLKGGYVGGIGNIEINGYSRSIAQWLQENSSSSVNLTAQASQTLYGAAGDDTLTAAGSGVALYGGAGFDTFDLSEVNTVGGVTIDLHSGDGRDSMNASLQQDTVGRELVSLRFTQGVARSSLRLFKQGTTNGPKFGLSYGSEGDVIYFTGDQDSGSKRPFDVVALADGSSVTWEQLQAEGVVVNLPEDAGNFDGSGTFYADRIVGRIAADSIDALSGDDIIDGAAGNDTVDGGLGSDVFLFGVGDGQDIVVQSARQVGDQDVLKFKSDVSLADVVFVRSGDNLVARILTSSDTAITVLGAFTTNALHHVEFADGTSIALANLPLSQAQEQATIGNDTIYLDSSGQAIDALAGDDLVYGGSGNDSILGSSGTDTLYGGAGDDHLNGGDGDNDVLYGEAGDDVLHDTRAYRIFGGDGNDVITGSAQEVNAGSGNDIVDAIAPTIDLGRGNDTYVVRPSFSAATSGTTYLNATTIAGETKTIRFADGLRLSDLTVHAVGSDLQIKVRNSSITLVLSGFMDFSLPSQQLFRFTFEADPGADYSYSDFYALGNTPTAGDDWIRGAAFGESINGLAGDDTIFGYGGDDTLEGGSGNDIILGGDGDDLLIAGSGSDTLSGGAGTDTYKVSRTGGYAVISEQMSCDADIILFDTDVSPDDVRVRHQPTMHGTTAVDHDIVLEVVDSVSGSVINTVVVTNGFATAVSAGGIGSVRFAGHPSVIWTSEMIRTAALSGGQKNDVLLGFQGRNDVIAGQEGDDSLSGFGGDDILFGGNGADTLRGGDGDDLLEGGVGDDLLYGDLGSDTYHLGNGSGFDRIYESGHSGIPAMDTVRFSSNVQPTHISLQRHGNDLVILNNATLDQAWVVSYFSGSGDSKIERIEFFDGTVWDAADIAAKTAFGTANTMTGGAGNDNYVVDNVDDAIIEGVGQGIDSVSSSVTWTASANVENVTLTGGLRIDVTGNALNNVLIGNAAGNVLTGGGGVDTLIGGAGDDSYYGARFITELAGEGIDTVYQTEDYTLGANLENLTLIGSSSFSQTATGNDLDNVIIGRADRFDTLDGGLGADTMIGGQGATFRVDNVGDVLILNSVLTTYSIVQSAVNWTLGSQMDELRLLGGSSATTAYGNNKDNLLFGNQNSNVLYGYAGKDRIYGGTGAATFYGGTGDDTYYVDGGLRNQVRVRSNGAAMSVDRAYIESPSLNNKTVVELAGEGIDLVYSIYDYTLTDNVENLKLESFNDYSAGANTLRYALVGTGNALNNVISGNAGNNVLDGKAGFDTLEGGDGNDSYYVDSVGDVIVESSGYDIVYSSISYTLGAALEQLVLIGSDEVSGQGNAMDNTLDGSQNSASNVLSGGTGDDTYLLGLGDTIVELAGGGTDTVRSFETISLSIFDNVENATLLGSSAASATGNAGSNRLDGLQNIAANVLAGGGGDDTYIVGTGDTVLEAVGQGTDTVIADGSYTLGANLENLTLTGAGTATGNALDNVVTAGASGSTLDGGAGADRLVGGSYANLTFVVDNVGDSIEVNTASQPHAVRSSISYVLAANNLFNNLTLTGSADIDATGNALANALTGNAGSNLLNGGAGDDIMAGGGGDDTYVVDSFGDVVDESVGQGTDSVQSSVSYGLGVALENLTLTGAASINGTGNDLANMLTGNAGANLLDGRMGADTMVGGGGDDTYVVDDQADVVAELGGGGIDLVQSLVTYTLAANVEHLTLTGLSNIDGTGNSLANWLNGNVGNNVLDGGFGVDTMTGGAGDDIYVVDSAADIVVEGADGGFDTVQALASYQLAANVESLTLLGSSDVDGAGNAGNNVLRGNTGNNVLVGGAGNDTILGGAGNDTVRYELGDGDDFVDNRGSVLGETDDIEFGIGILASETTFTSQDDDLIVHMAGGLGTVTVAGFFSNAGNERLLFQGGVIYTRANLPLSRGTEGDDALVLTSANDVVDTLGGNDFVDGAAGEDSLAGGTGDDTLVGGAGNDSLSGGTGDDLLAGNQGNDVYVYNAGDGFDVIDNQGALATDVDDLVLGPSVIETTTTFYREGDDLRIGFYDSQDGIRVLNFFTGSSVQRIVFASGTVYTKDNLPNSSTHTVVGTENDDYLFGSAEDETILGLGGDDNLAGNGGNDTLDGGAGGNNLNGGAGRDTYRIAKYGDGQHVYAQATGDGDIIEFGAGVLPENLVAYDTYEYVDGERHPGTSLILHIVNASDRSITNSLSIDSFFSSGSGFAGIGKFRFTDAPEIVWTPADILALFPSSGDDHLIRGVNGDYVDAGEGNDYVDGGAATDELFGGAGEDTLLGGAGQDYLYGGDGDDQLHGGEGVDYLTGDAGIDTLAGGEGDDVYMVGDSFDQIIELSGEGLDTVYATASYVLGANVETLYLQGEGNLDGTGNASDNHIYGTDGDNVLNGGAGADTLSGGGGHDTYIVDNVGDVVDDYDGSVDLVISSVSWNQGDYIFDQDLTLSGTADIDGRGSGGANRITGNSGNNVLDGYQGADTLVGGLGNDTYIVDNASDTIIEEINSGIDTVRTSVAWVLGDNLENLELVGYVSQGTGNAADNLIRGSFGSSTIDGGAGADTMLGGAGDDTYVVDQVGDVVIEAAGEGNDAVRAAVSYALTANVESLTLTGSADNDATGTSANNFLYGNSGSNVLNGGIGNDYMAGGVGDDTYVVDATGDTVFEAASAGVDSVLSSVSYTLTSNVENLILTGSNSVNATGNALANVLNGNSAANSLNGAAGADTMAGGAGNDVYVVESSGDVVSENESEGIDLVQAAITYSLAANIENLTLTGTGNLNGTGNELDNVLVGNAGNNVLSGDAGADSMSGGAGNDTYVVDDLGDTVTEASASGTDTVQSSVDYTLSANVENLTLTGLANLVGTGNTLANNLVGGVGDNVLNGGAGADTMAGGLGDDTYVVDNSADVVTEGAGGGTDTVQSSVTFAASANVENLILTGTAAINATGNTLANFLTGNGGANTIDGGAGADTMSGGAGNDVYVVDNVGDVVVELASGGTDTVQSSVTYTLSAEVEKLTLTGTGGIGATGNGLANTLTGNAGNNTLNGDVGNDTMIGGAGNDTYVVDAAGDVVTELDAEGTDTVQSSVTYVLGNFVENLTLTGSGDVNGTGNALANSIVGNAGNNLLNGGAGTDTMAGGLGDDTYVVDVATDVVTEAANGGTDTVQTALSYTLGANVENLLLTGSAAMTGTGNGLANVLTGNSADNTLNGGVGADTMVGGAGNDTYVVDNIGDVVTENGGAGTDLVQSSVTYAISANIEALMLTGTAAINATGNATANTLTGNSGANTLDGGAGADTMVGGAGNDIYVVDSAADVVTELASEGTDMVQSSVNHTLAANVESLTLTGTSAINGTGNTTANALTGNAMANTLDGGAGNDSLVGGLGNDVYLLGRGYGVDQITENDSTASNNDTARFAADVANDQLWFRKVGNNLEVSIIGTSDQFLINNWYLGNDYHVETFKSGNNKTLSDTQVQNLVQAMAAFSPPAAEQTTLPAAYSTALAPTIAANWQ